MKKLLNPKVKELVTKAQEYALQRDMETALSLLDPEGGIVDSVTVPELPADSAFVQDSGSWFIGTPSPWCR